MRDIRQRPSDFHGLEWLTVGSLAGQLQRSKRCLFAHFGSQQDLQLASIEAARTILMKKVTRQALKGMPRFYGLLERWLEPKNALSQGAFSARPHRRGE
jgi:hypothetical protein